MQNCNKINNKERIFALKSYTVNCTHEIFIDKIYTPDARRRSSILQNFQC